MPTYKLTYFDNRGRGELIRLVFSAAGIKFKDNRIASDDWPGDYKKESPYGQIPFIEIDGKVFSQSFAIARYIARINNLYGTNALESLAIDEVVGLNDDYYIKFLNAFFLSPSQEAKMTNLQTLHNVDLPKHLQNLEGILARTGSGYYVGNTISLADLSSYDVLENGFMDNPEVFKQYPKVLANRNTIRTSTKLKSYLDNRKVTPV